MATSEAELQRQVTQLLRVTPDIADFPTSMQRQGGVKFTQSRKGTPDHLFCYFGLFVGFEYKSWKNNATPEQKNCGYLISRSGGFWFVIRSLDDALAALAQVQAAAKSLGLAR